MSEGEALTLSGLPFETVPRRLRPEHCLVIKDLKLSNSAPSVSGRQSFSVKWMIPTPGS